MTTLSSYWILLLIGAALLGFLIAWLLRASKMHKWKGQFEDKEAAYARLKSKHTKFLSKQEELETSHNQLKASNRTLTNDLTSYKKKYERLERRVDAVPTSTTTASTPEVKIVEKVIDNSYEIKAWESKYAKLGRDLASKESELFKLQEENESIYTKLAVLEETVEEATRQKEKALASIHKYENYKPRFEQANLERNTLKYKYEQLLAAGSTVAFAQTAIPVKKKEVPIPVAAAPDNSALLAEINQLKATLAATTEEKEEALYQITSLQVNNSAADYKHGELKVMYHSLLALHERTDIKKTVLQEKLDISNGQATPEDLASKLEGLLIEINDLKNKCMALGNDNNQLQKDLSEALLLVPKVKKKRKKKVSA